MRAVHAEIEVAAPPARVLEAVLEVEQMRQWWSVHSGRVDAQPGGVWALTWDVAAPGFGFVVLSGVISVLRPAAALTIDPLLYFNRERSILGPMTLSFTVEPGPSGCRLGVLQEGYGEGRDWDWYYELVKENWPRALEALKQFIEGR